MSTRIDTKFRARLLACALLATVACGDDDSPGNDDGLDTGGESDAGVEVPGDTDAGDAPNDAPDGQTTRPEGDAGTTAKDPRFVAATQVFVGMSATSYLIVTDSARAGALETDDALPLPGRAIVASPEKAGYFFVGTSEGPDVTRYTLDDGGKPVKGRSVSFLDQGVSGIGEYQTQFQFVSSTKAYYFDAKTAQAVIWNPTAMTVTGTIDLGELVAEGQIVAFSSTPTRRGDEVVMPVGFRSADNTRIVGGAAAVIIDSTDDSVVIARDERCGYVRDAVTTDDGSIYIATEAYGSSVHRIAAPNAPTPCLLRIASGEKEFDTDFYADLNELAGGATVGSLALLPSGTAYVHVLDDSLVEITPSTNARVLASSTAWNWAEITLGDEPAIGEVTSLPTMAGSIIAFPVADEFLVAEFVNFSESTTLRDLLGAGEDVLSSAGLLFSFTQVD